MSSDLATGSAASRHPQDWYVEQMWTVRALMRMVTFGKDSVIWDPCCGLGTIPLAFCEAGYKAAGTDLVDRWLPWSLPLFLGEHDFLGAQRHMLESALIFDIVANPPFSYEEAMAERFVRRALRVARGKVCMLLPLKWRASETRFPLFEEYPPKDILVFCDRPSMPPGNMLDAIDARGRLTAWQRGKVDYCWYVWDRHHFPRPDTIIRSIPPRSAEQKRADRDEDLRRVRVLPVDHVEQLMGGVHHIINDHFRERRAAQ